MRAYAILILCLMGGVAMATAAPSTAVKVVESKDLITDILGLWDWAVGLLETLGVDILDVLGQFLPAELVDILQILVDLGIVPIAKRDIIGDLLAAISALLEGGLDALGDLADLIPEPILSILEVLLQLGLLPGQVHLKQSIEEWLLALLEILNQIGGDITLDLLIQVAEDLGIPPELIQELWDLINGGGAAVFKPSPAHAARRDIIDWAIQLLEELGLGALEQLAEFLPPELISILVDLVLGIGLPARA